MAHHRVLIIVAVPRSRRTITFDRDVFTGLFNSGLNSGWWYIIPRSAC
jgi:hypothetical protein